MSGKAAALGGRLMAPASEQLLKQFVANFAARLDAMQDTQATSADTARTQAAQGGAAVDSETTAPVARAATPPPAQAAELNGFAFIWAMIRDWLHGRFSHKAQGR
jgi:hypothetical protein